ncbi:YusW family protein [Sporosarcina sp. HYO08]|uniref:YusW family protein n=1 Tax=Sporosarcina sp. HYO08 TaxID=1759557 RepID=UPI00079617D5|nr:YusW family protein [Sporosarcina sp. HYO08]KXH81953.1 hypothetical protein AU377_06755 [Sporosarcina sp. HYO08]
MKKLGIIWMILCTSILIVSGCGNLGKNADQPQREEADIIHEDEKEGGSLETGAGYGFTSFDLDIDVNGKDTIEADYETTENQLKAEYIDARNNVQLQDTKAMDELHKLFMKILIRHDTPQQEVIDKILEWYAIDQYSKFDLEVHFDDGTTLNIEEMK